MDEAKTYRTEAFILSETKHFGKHPAKMNVELARRLVDEYTTPGQWVLDPMAGCGTVPIIAADMGRKSAGVELEAQYITNHTCNGDTFSLPFRDGQFDAIITSPPYGEAIGRAGDRDIQKTIAAKDRYEQRRFGKSLTNHAVYGIHPKNVGSMPLQSRKKPSFVDSMAKILKEWYRVLGPQGMLITVIKDQRKGRKRLGLFDMSGFIVQTATTAGFMFVERRVAIIPPENWTLWMRVNEQRWNIPITNCEYILVFRKQ